MKAIIHCVRHAEGEHNLANSPPNLIDPLLTTHGREQCLELQSTASSIHPHISLIAASPMIRTLQTAFLAFEPALKNGHCKTQILGLPDAQEVCDYPFNTGSEPSVLQERAASQNLPVDLCRVTEDWNMKVPGSRYFPSRAALRARARDCRRQIFELAFALNDEGVKDPQIVLVAHGGFLHFFTEDWEDAATGSGTGWQNAEMRSYYLQMDKDVSGDEGLSIVEMPESRQRRGKGPLLPSGQEQERLFEQAMLDWEGQGLHEIP